MLKDSKAPNFLILVFEYIFLQSNFSKLVSNMQKNMIQKMQFLREKKGFFTFFFNFLLHFYQFKSQLTQKITNYSRFPSQWLILSTKII